MKTSADGKIHKIDDKWAYILLKIPVYVNENLDLNEYKEKMMIEYVNYLLEFDKDLCICIIVSSLNRKFFENQQIEFIFKEPSISSMIDEFATLALKFPRAIKDNLDE